MKKYLLFIIFFFASSIAFSDEYTDEEKFQKPTIFEIQAKEKQARLDTLAEEARDYSVMNNKWYENDKIKIYNHSLYEFDPADHKMEFHQAEPSITKDLKFSIGYGMEYKIDQYRKVGYEYVSNYPYDRGQMIRFFWSKDF